MGHASLDATMGYLHTESLSVRSPMEALASSLTLNQPGSDRMYERRDRPRVSSQFPALLSAGASISACANRIDPCLLNRVSAQRRQ